MRSENFANGRRRDRISMAMFRSHNNKILVFLLIELWLSLCENGLTGRRRTTTAAANGNTEISGPFLQIERSPVKRLSITKAHWEHFLHCNSSIDEAFNERHKPNLFYTWYRNGNALQGQMLSGRRSDFFIFDNGTLRLPPSERAAGRYNCQVNANAIAIISESITVDYPVLRRTPAPANVTVSSGRPITLNCPVLSVPPANITWFFRNMSLAKKLKENRYLILANGSLLITNIDAQDGGKYKCSAHNQFANKTHRQFILTLTVDDGVERGRRPPLAVRYGQLVPPLQEPTQYVPAGQSFRLRCRTVSAQVPIEWWFQRVPSAPVEKLSNYSGEYQVQRAAMEQHEGYYTCSTPKDKQTFHVVVTSPPSILRPMPSYESHIAATLSFSCMASGNPVPEITWYHNAAPINNSFSRYIATNELRIHSFDPDEEGIYQCFARNVAGEASTEGEIRLRGADSMEAPLKNPLRNIRCFAHSFNTINVTFDQVSFPLYLIFVHIFQSNPHRWTSITPLEPNHSSYVVISSQLPLYRPFQLITRALLRTVGGHSGSHNVNEEPILSSLRSQPVTCCTQGLLLHVVDLLHNDSFVTWSQPDLLSKKYYILQFSANYTEPHPRRLRVDRLRGTTAHVELNKEDIGRKLQDLRPLDETATEAVLERIESREDRDNGARAGVDRSRREAIFSLVVAANVTGVLLQNFTRVKMRVLIVTAENEDLRQDFRYVQWKIIENETSDISNLPFKLIKIESRTMTFAFQDSFPDDCVKVCYSQIQFPVISHEDSKCEELKIRNSQLEVRSLKPTKLYRLNFASCKARIFYGQQDVLTLADPPGTISNQRITKQNGLKLSWDPPLHPNGRVHHYNILWTVNNVTHEANVFECSQCFYKFPHVSETSKINITVRVVGENGIGAPIFIDLRDINHHTLEVEQPSNTDVYSGIAIGAMLSGLCVFFFALLIVCQRRRYKLRSQQAPIHLTSQSETNFSQLNTTGIPGDSAGGLSGSTLQHEYHEMQTLIPKSRNIPFLTNERPPNEYQTTQLPVGNGNGPQRRPEHNDQESAGLKQSEAKAEAPLCTSTPIGKAKTASANAGTGGAKPYFIPFKQMPHNAGGGVLLKHSSSPNFQSIAAAAPPTSLPFVGAATSTSSSSNGRRSGSLSNSSTSNGSSGGGNTRRSSNGSHRHFHTNFPKHSNSNDGICLLAEEESTATLTPTSETETGGVADAVLTNGFTASSQKSPLIPPSSPITHAPVTSAGGNINNNNTNKKYNLFTKSADNQAHPQQQQQQLQHGPSLLTHGPIVPTTSSSTVLKPAGATAGKHWASAAATSATTNLHRRPNVDPNG